MGKNLLLFVSSICLVGCAVDKEELSAVPEPEIRISEVVPVEEALDQLYAMQRALNASTRASSAPSIGSIAVCGGSHATRGSVVNLPDTMVYVVNFTDNRGFAVLGARRSLEPVYAITESGTLDASKLDEALARAEVCRQAAESSAESTARTRANDDATFSDAGPDFVYEQLAAGVGSTDGTDRPPMVSDKTFLYYGDWEATKTVGPLVTVKWNQTYPFNAAMPQSTAWSGPYYKEKYPVGCTVVAMSQVLSSTRRPVTPPTATTKTYYWSNLNTVSNYINLAFYMPSKYNDTTNPVYTQQLADVMYNIGKRFNVSSNSTGTDATRPDVLKGVKGLDSYYANAYYGSPVFVKLKGLIDAGKPVYMQGFEMSSGAGHAWVVDGYADATQEEIYSVKLSWGPGTATMTEKVQHDLLHINWGFSGEYDGYFLSDVFNMKKRAYKDGVMEGNVYEDHSLNNWGHNFNINIEAIYY